MKVYDFENNEITKNCLVYCPIGDRALVPSIVEKLVIHEIKFTKNVLNYGIRIVARYIKYASFGQMGKQWVANPHFNTEQIYWIEKGKKDKNGELYFVCESLMCIKNPEIISKIIYERVKK